MKKISFLTLILLAIFSTASVAEEAGEKKSDTIRACLNGTTEQLANHIIIKCTGLMVDECLKNKKNADTAAMANCYREEGLVWNSVLNENYQKLKGQLNKEQFEALTDFQREWIKLVQNKCLLTNKLYEGSISRVIAAQCSHGEIVRRAVELHLLRKELPAK